MSPFDSASGLAQGARPRVHQILATLGYGDAIGNEVLGINRALRRAGYESEIIVETFDRRMEELTVDYRDMVGEVGPDDLLIHHFSLGSRASRTAFAMPARMMLIYHNITPPEYFLGVHEQLVRQCYHGRRELLPYRSRCDLALGDSVFNREELDALGFSPTDVLPVVPDFSHLECPPAQALLQSCDDNWTNILFVGRLIPNKRPDNLIRYFHAYKSLYNPRARLLLAGSFGGFEVYYAQLQSLVARLGVQDVHILGHISNEELTALYDVADLFLCASEHEGFCVPIMEAFYKQVPVIARAATAVPATMDGGGVLYDTTDPRRVAALMHAVVSSAAVEDEIIERQDAALARLLALDFDGMVIRFVERVLSSPRKPMPPIDPDFWRQFRQTDELEEIRMSRPAAFRALPVHPDASQLAYLGSRK
ncbi:MAG TPA: glycosyltransferase family 4 protein [Vicinamibacterales bacterium]|nr:glycosyltransferase family 4 protein [Vicinamibacterales bacterium]